MALIGQTVSEKIFEYYGNIHVHCPGVGADMPLGCFFQNHISSVHLPIFIKFSPSNDCYFPIVCLWELMTPGAGPFLTPGALLAGFIKRATIHCYTQNMKALGLVVLEKIFFLCFSHDAPGMGPVWTPGARLAGFIKRTTIHCYKQYIKALGLVVSEKKIFLCFSHCKSVGANNPGAG